MNNASQIILAIESAIGGGSISLLRDGVEIANWMGTSNVSKAEDLLANIDTMLVENIISRNDIDMIAVSAGPGSFTGIRIGIATALGLKAGLGIVMSSQTALKAMAFSDSSESLIVALPVGRNAVCVQVFQNSNREVIALDEPQTVTEEDLLNLIRNKINSTFLLHSSLFDNIESAPNVKNFGKNIALAIAHICRENPGKIVEPLFISKSF